MAVLPEQQLKQLQSQHQQKQLQFQPYNQNNPSPQAVPTAPGNNVPISWQSNNTPINFQTTPGMQLNTGQPAQGLDNLRNIMNQVQQNQGAFGQNIMGNINQYQQAVQQNAQQMQQLAQQVAEQMQFATSPEAFQQILAQVMESYNPLIEQQRMDITDQYGNMIERQDEDSARRGLFNSGVAQQMVKDLEVDRERQISRALADIQAMAAQQAGDFQDRMITGVRTQGDWLRDDRKTDDESLRSLIDTYLRSEGMIMDKEAQDRNFILNSEEIFEQARQFEARLAEDIRQFDENMEQRKAEFKFDMDKFAQQMKLNWAEFNANEKARATQARIAAMNASLAQQQYKDKKEMDALQASRDKLMDLQTAYSIIENSKDKDSAFKQIKPFKDMFDQKTYNDLISTINKKYYTPPNTNKKPADSNYLRTGGSGF